MQITDSAFILKLTKYQETSFIASILTSEHGMIQTISKGVRSTKKQSHGNIYEVGNLVDVEMNVNPLKSLQYLQKIVFRDSISQGLFSPIRQSLITYIMEISEKSIYENSEQSEIYELLLKYFSIIKSVGKEELYTLPLLFTLDLYDTLGYQVDLWLKKHTLTIIDLQNAQLCHRGQLLDDFLKYVNHNFQPLRPIKSLSVIRSFIQII